jgi:hypothetical protein
MSDCKDCGKTPATTLTEAAMADIDTLTESMPAGKCKADHSALASKGAKSCPVCKSKLSKGGVVSESRVTFESALSVDPRAPSKPRLRAAFEAALAEAGSSYEEQQYRFANPLKFDPKKHPRGRGGKFINVMNKLAPGGREAKAASHAHEESRKRLAKMNMERYGRPDAFEHGAPDLLKHGAEHSAAPGLTPAQLMARYAAHMATDSAYHPPGSDTGAEEERAYGITDGFGDGKRRFLATPAPAHTPQSLRREPYNALAQIARDDWGPNITPRGVELLDVMRSMRSVYDHYMLSSGTDYLSTFLANARGWRGPTARMVKAEMRRRLQNADPGYANNAI